MANNDALAQSLPEPLKWIETIELKTLSASGRDIEIRVGFDPNDSDDTCLLLIATPTDYFRIGPFDRLDCQAKLTQIVTALAGM